MEEEIWKDIKGWEGRYQISSKQRVRSLLDFHLRPLAEPRIKKTYVGSHGYEVVSFYYHKKMHLLKIHRLVAEAFIPNPENKPEVNHINGIKTDNRIENLEWATRQENSDHAHRTGLMHPPRGEDSGMAIWTEQEVIDIKTDINNGLSCVELFDKYPKLDNKHLYLFRKNKTWKHLKIRVREGIKIPKASRRSGKYTENQVREVVEYAAANPKKSQWQIGERFGIPQGIVSKMIRGVYSIKKEIPKAQRPSTN